MFWPQRLSTDIGHLKITRQIGFCWNVNLISLSLSSISLAFFLSLLTIRRARDDKFGTLVLF